MSKYRFHFFVHSMVSDWNHGNAHFLRGLVQSLMDLGHTVRCFEELGSWSLTNLVQNEGARAISAIDQFRETYPNIEVQFYKRDEGIESALRQELSDCDFAIIHEWNDPQFVNQILALKQDLRFKALFHDTHHRAVSALNDLLKFHLHLFDGVLAFGDAVRHVYKDGLGIENVWTFHEAADTNHFKPKSALQEADLCWVGNWGDDERTKELQEFLVRPSEQLALRTIVHGVRYPEQALAQLQQAGIDFRGYLPNLCAPEVYASSAISLHVPRRDYTQQLAGVPTIRVFEALACGAPLVCAPWDDSESLFRKGDYVIARNEQQMTSTLRELLDDPKARAQLGANGRETVLARHTCRHRAEQLLEIVGELA